MDIKKINKLLDSRREDDILIGVALSYKLSFEEFDKLYYDQRETHLGGDSLYYRFRRNGIEYGFGNACFIRYDIHEDSVTNRKIDITPENFKA